MRAVSQLVAVSILVMACGGGQAGRPPAPQSIHVRLRFAKNDGPLRYKVHLASSQAVGQITFKRQRTLWVTQVVEDSLDARLIHVKIDSGRGSAKMPTAIGSFPGFMGWFNEQRDRLDTSATDYGVEMYRADVFDGTMPLPPDLVGVGDLWNAGPSRRTMFHVEETPVHAGAHGVVKAIRVTDADTVAVLGLTLDVKGKITLRDGREIDVHGEEKGEETFSVNQGITLRLHVVGKVEWDTDVMTPGGLQSVYTILHTESDRSLIP